MEDKTGINIRYMVEAARLNDDFFTNLAEPEKTFESDEGAKNSAEEADVSSESAGLYSDAK